MEHRFSPDFERRLAEALVTCVKLTPSYHGKDCLANGEHRLIACGCDECDHWMTCFPDWHPGAVWDEDTERYI